jgi:tetratricopeptide (TPR) repeat protein
MTLVVARKVENSVFIIGDTKLTLELTKEKVKVTEGVIKTRLMGALSISFSGNEHIAERAIRLIQPHDTLYAAAERLLAEHRSIPLKDTAEFIIASAEPDRKILVVKGGVIESTDAAWIGYYPAFVRFREYETGERKRPQRTGGNIADITMQMMPDEGGPVVKGGDAYSNMLRSLMNVIDDTDVDFVGGIAVPTATSGPVFKYLGYAEVRSSPFEIRKGENPVPFGTAEKGGYSFDFNPNDDQLGASSYFLQGRFGLLFRLPDEQTGFLRPHIITDVNPLEFEERASETAGAAVRTFYSGPGNLCERAMARIAAGDIEGAKADADRAVAKFEKSPDSWRCRALISLRLNEPEKALADARRAAELGLFDALAWNTLGCALIRCDQGDEAARAFTRAIAIGPAVWEPYSNRSRVYWTMGRHEEALADVSVALHHQPNNLELLNNRAAACIELGMLEQALHTLERASVLAPDDRNLQTNITALRTQLGRQAMD